MATRPHRATEALARACGCCAAAITLVGVLGCSRPLLSPKDERSPFDRYDAVRSRHAPQYVEDAFGRRQPNLRGRLEPRD
ncbi:MAG: hypothetical protein KF699_12635 [Phycisphaeraceae bacterium]|nr:hypothetical protein [Phycisphaeraceae bacterium]MBX3406885.1 hypothetical protein [Phycisphaeraceae bacterium]